MFNKIQGKIESFVNKAMQSNDALKQLAKVLGYIVLALGLITGSLAMLFVIFLVK